MVQVIGQASLIKLREKIDFLFTLFNLRPQRLQIGAHGGEAMVHFRARRAQGGGIVRAQKAREHVVVALQLALQSFTLSLQALDVGMGFDSLLGDFIKAAPGLAHFFSGRPSEDKIAQEFEQQSFKDLEAVGVAHKIAEQDVVLEEELIVLAALHKQQAVGQQIVGLAELVAEQGAARLGQDGLLKIENKLAELLAGDAIDVAAVGLKFGESSLHHLGALAALEHFAAAANPFVALLDDKSKLRGNFARQKTENGQTQQDVKFDILLEMRAVEPGLQQVTEDFAESGSFRRAQNGGIGAVKAGEIARLANQVGDITPRKFQETRAEGYIVVQVVDARRERGELHVGDIGHQVNLHLAIMRGLDVTKGHR